MTDHYHIFEVGGKWTVALGDRRDPDLTQGIRTAFDRLADTSVARIKGLFESFLNHRMHDGESTGSFVGEQRDQGVERIENMLENLGFECLYSNREDEATHVRRGAGASFGVLPTFIQSLDLLYASLHRQGLRELERPTKVHGFQTLTPTELNDRRRTLYGSVKKGASYNGTQFLTIGRETYPLRFEDPRGLGRKMRSAAEADRWKDPAYDLLCVIDDDGCRFEDSHALNAHDWARWDFGCVIAAPNKGSDGDRVKTVVIGKETALQLARSFDDDPARPSMAELRRMVEIGDEAGLRAVALFPSALGKPFAYHTYNNDYVRPTMERHNVMIHSKFTSVRATIHRLRAGKIQAELEHILLSGQVEDEQKWRAVDQLRQDMSIKSKKSFYRYCGELVDMIAADAKVRRHEIRVDRRPQTGGLVMPVRRQNGTPNHTDQRLSEIAR